MEGTAIMLTIAVAAWLESCTSDANSARGGTESPEAKLLGVSGPLATTD